MIYIRLYIYIFNFDNFHLQCNYKSFYFLFLAVIQNIVLYAILVYILLFNFILLFIYNVSNI